jgi:TetR/AcrR family fatty acid metabolism transcriptional regulator
MNIHSEGDAMSAISDEKQGLIRQAAVRLFSRKGFYNTRAEEIAREAGIAVGTIYNYFASKEEILLSIFKTEFEDRLLRFQQLLKSDLPIAEKIRRILDEHFSQLKEHTDMAQLMMQEQFNPGKEFRTRLMDLYREMIGRIEELIQEGMEKNWVRQCHPKIIAHAMIGVVQSISVYALMHPDAESQRVLQDAPRELADLIWNGLHKEEISETS